MTQWRGVVPIVVALIIALAGSVLTYTWLKKQSATQQKIVKVESDAVQIAVALTDLPWGTVLKKEHIKFTPFLKETLPPKCFTDLAQLEGRVLIAQTKEKEPILESKLAPDTVKVGGISAVVKPGMRALAVKGDKVIGLSGLIQPGNRVDVLVTFTNPQNQRDTTKVVLEDILVLATGTEIQKADKDKSETSPVDVFTLEVTPEDGEKLALAAAQGKLQFALRNVIDVETVFTKGATIPSTLRAYKKLSNKKGVVNPAVRKVYVIKGTKTSSVSF
jgi:pilus assembly protein CpaB